MPQPLLPSIVSTGAMAAQLWRPGGPAARRRAPTNSSMLRDDVTEAAQLEQRPPASHSGAVSRQDDCAAQHDQPATLTLAAAAQIIASESAWRTVQSAKCSTVPSNGYNQLANTNGNKVALEGVAEVTLCTAEVGALFAC